MPVKRTPEQFVKEMAEIDPTIEILSDYITSNDRVKCRCKICGREWDVAASGLLSGNGCKKCKTKKALENRQGKTKRKTHSEFIAEVAKVNPNIEIISEYRALRFKIRCRCKIDGHEWDCWSQALLKGHGCPKCSAKRASERLTISHEDFIKRVHSVNKNIVVKNTYYGNTTRMDCVCSDCGYKWNTAASQLLSGCNCPKCAATIRAREYYMLSQEEFVSRMSITNPNIKILGIYMGSDKKIDCKCLSCGYEWDALPSNLLKGEGCPKCRNSHGETIVARYLDSINIKYNVQYRFDDCRYVRPLPFDFYLPDYNACIEYDGEQHYWPIDFAGRGKEHSEESFRKTKERDVIKTKYCENNNIRLLRIPYWELNNVKQVISNFLT